MTDYTAEIAELEAAYRANRVANASIATEVRSKYRTIIADEIRRRKQEVDLDFAHTLARVKARSDMPLGVIQEHILHTKAWDRWVYWRDLANIDPERVSVNAARDAKRIAESPFQFSADYLTLRVTKDSTGAELAEPVVYDMTTNQWADNKWWPNSSAEGMNISDAEKAAVEQDKKFRKYVSDYIQTEIDNETITNPKGN